MLRSGRTIILAGVLLIVGLFVLAELRLSAQPAPGGRSGPDVIVGDIPDVRRWGSQGGATAFSIATTSCNIGNAPLDWLVSPSPLHPVITQNLYRVRDGRIEQLGMSWLKHGFSVAAGSLCGNCQDLSSIRLGVNCSDPYSAGLNGFQSGLGPRSEVNAATGQFVVPFSTLPTPRTLLDGRIRVANADLDPPSNPAARYFVESQYIHPQDSAAGNSANNASHRETFVVVNGADLHLELRPASPTVREEPAIAAWKSVHPDVALHVIDVPGDGRAILGIRTAAGSGGGSRTSIAIENLTSHRSIRSVKVTFAAGTPMNPGFRDVDYQHEPYSGTDWTTSTSGASIEWSTETFTANQNANALRWGTLYTFWCDIASRPTVVEVGFFRPGMPPSLQLNLQVEPKAMATSLKPSADWALVEKSVDVESIRPDRPATVGLACRPDLERSIASVQSSNQHIKASYRDTDNPKAWRIVITPQADAPAGYFESILTIQSGTPSDDPVRIRVFGNIEKQTNG